MSIKSDILAGMKKSRRKYHTSDQLDDFAVGNIIFPPTEHGVRARISELTTSGEIFRVSLNKYTIYNMQELHHA